MAVTTTVLDILLAAYGKSTKNRAGAIATEDTELLQMVTRALRGLFAGAARVNPEFFGVSEDVAFAAPGWARPEAAESVFRIEDPVGTEVVVVPLDDRGAEAGKPAVTRFGQVYRSAGNALDPLAGDLTFFYAKRADAPATTADTLDPMWPESYNELLVLEVAIYLALKDGRTDEAQTLGADRLAWLTLWVAFLQHETANVRRRYGHLRQVNVAELLPLLAGGGS